MNSIRIKNLRSFKDTGEIQLKDINLLVGQNSSGKSTFLRFFPLIKQSILRNTKGPILWNDENLVDFGSYAEAKNRYSSDDEITFSFNLDLTLQSGTPWFHASKIKQRLNTKIAISIIEKNKKSYINALNINFEDQEIKLEILQNNTISKFVINNQQINLPDELNFENVTNKSFIPNSIFIRDELAFDYLNSKFSEKIRAFVNNKNIDILLPSIFKNSLIGSKKDLLNGLQTEMKLYNKEFAKLDINSSEFIELNNYFLLFHLGILLKTLNDSISSFFTKTDYIAPVRAKALRYYRRQDLSVENIDAYGDNLPMFIDNLTIDEEKSFQEFVKYLFGFSPETESQFGHIVISIKNNQNESFNLADLGFGYSQLLPIATKLWYALYKNKEQITLLIEQPELHLHPAMQAQVADAFTKTIEIAKSKNIKLKLVIETHSPIIINRIGKKVREKSLSNEMVNIILFELDNELKYSKVTTTEFNDKGIIKNWPLGFFEPKN